MLLQRSPGGCFCPQQDKFWQNFLSNSATEGKHGPCEDVYENSQKAQRSEESEGMLLEKGKLRRPALRRGKVRLGNVLKSKIRILC